MTRPGITLYKRYLPLFGIIERFLAYRASEALRMIHVRGVIFISTRNCNKLTTLEVVEDGPLAFSAYRRYCYRHGWVLRNGTRTTSVANGTFDLLWFWGRYCF